MEKISINKNWRFYLGDPGAGKWNTPDDTDWRLVDLPHDWSIELPRKADNPSTASGGFFTNGRAWYHHTFTAPQEWQGKKVIVQFEGVYMNAEVRLNGHYLGRHPYGYTSFSYDLTPYIKIGENNLLRVCVDNLAQMNSRWYSGSGIYRPAWLLVSDMTHIAEYGVFVTTPQISAETAVVNIATTLLNETELDKEVTLVQRVVSPNSTILGENKLEARLTPGQTAVFNQELRVAYPQLWSPENPVLYRVETVLQSNGQMIDREETNFGIRSIQVDAINGFLLNGKSIKLKGGCVHHDHGVLGSASFSSAEERKVALHKASGYNSIRCAHNPPAPAFLDACDRLGMLVIDEAFDCWNEPKNPYDYHVAFADWWQRDIQNMLLRDRNHPSVVVWSIGNEVLERDGRSGGTMIARNLAQAIRDLDTTRPITSAICGIWDNLRTWNDTDSVFATLDIGGYNYQWQKYQSDHQRHPNRVMMGTESFPLEALVNWRQVEEHSYVVGDFVWTSMDYLGEAGIGRVTFDGPDFKFLGDYPWHQAYCGDIDLCGFKRPQSYYRDIVWGCGSPLYIAVHTPVPEGKVATVTRWGWPDVEADWNWPGYEGKMMKVDVYSACETVELFLNGKSYGKQPAGIDHNLTASFEIPYESGELKAIGYNQDRVETSLALTTTAPAQKLRLTPDRALFNASEDQLVYITVEVTDGEGRRCPKADHPIFFTLKGEGKIKAVGNSNPVSEEAYIGNQRRAHLGRCLVVVQSNGKAGEICLRAQADGLETAELVIHTR